MNSFPYGTVIFSVADIEGITKLYNPSAIVGVIPARHHEISIFSSGIIAP